MACRTARLESRASGAAAAGCAARSTGRSGRAGRSAYARRYASGASSSVASSTSSRARRCAASSGRCARPNERRSRPARPGASATAAGLLPRARGAGDDVLAPAGRRRAARRTAASPAAARSRPESGLARDWTAALRAGRRGRAGGRALDGALHRAACSRAVARRASPHRDGAARRRPRRGHRRGARLDAGRRRSVASAAVKAMLERSCGRRPRRPATPPGDRPGVPASGASAGCRSRRWSAAARSRAGSRERRQRHARVRRDRRRTSGSPVGAAAYRARGGVGAVTLVGRPGTTELRGGVESTAHLRGLRQGVAASTPRATTTAAPASDGLAAP